MKRTSPLEWFMLMVIAICVILVLFLCIGCTKKDVPVPKPISTKIAVSFEMENEDADTKYEIMISKNGIKFEIADTMHYNINNNHSYNRNINADTSYKFAQTRAINKTDTVYTDIKKF